MSQNKRAQRKRLRPSLACFKSAITNGSRLFQDVDGRSAWARRLRDLIVDYAADLGGADRLSTAEMALVRRAAMLVLQTELLEAKWQANDGVAGEKDLDRYQRVTNTLRRLLETLGLERRSRDVTPPDLKTYLARKQRNGRTLEMEADA